MRKKPAPDSFWAGTGFPKKIMLHQTYESDHRFDLERLMR